MVVASTEVDEKKETKTNNDARPQSSRRQPLSSMTDSKSNVPQISNDGKESGRRQGGHGGTNEATGTITDINSKEFKSDTATNLGTMCQK